MMRLPVRQRLIALALAGVYALLAAGGQGLHAISHAFASAGTSGANAHQACGCGDAGCFFAAQARSALGRSALGRAAQGQPEHPAGETTLHRAADRSGHDQHKCGLCQTLAQMKLAAAGGPAIAPHVTATAPAPIAPEGLSFPAILTAFDARGPPARG